MNSFKCYNSSAEFRKGQKSHTKKILRRYAILDGPTMPIVAEGDDEPNDTFQQQLIASAEAAVKVFPLHSPLI
jgi:hypothetical protein